MIRFLIAALVLISTVWSASAGECRNQSFRGTEMTVCVIDPSVDRIDLWLADDTGALLGSFERLSSYLETQGAQLEIAMSGGMYHPDRRPVGYFRAGETEISPLVTRAGPGNFGLLPNGVFCVSDTGPAFVMETLRFAETRPACRIATQSGPMLVIDGVLHPAFLDTSDSRLVRNGVGVSQDGLVYFVISNDPVNFFDFASFFRDELGTPNALFLEGRVSRFFARDLGRSDGGLAMGPILGVAASGS